ncbi:MAG: hypothetical protein ACHQF2_04475 [Flavobacteriales bacterium]
MNSVKKFILFGVLLLAGKGLIAQKKGTLVIEPEVGQLFTMLGPSVTDAIYPSQLCDSMTIVQCNDENIKVISYEITIELNRDFTMRVEGNRVPDTLCLISPRLRGEEMVYIEKVIGLDKEGNQVMLPPVRVIIIKESRRIEYDYDEADGVVPKNE